MGKKKSEEQRREEVKKFHIQSFYQATANFEQDMSNAIRGIKGYCVSARPEEVIELLFHANAAFTRGLVQLASSLAELSSLLRPDLVKLPQKVKR